LPRHAVLKVDDHVLSKDDSRKAKATVLDPHVAKSDVARHCVVTRLAPNEVYAEFF